MSDAIEAGPGTAAHPLKVAIVGSGPSGFYAAEALLASGLAVEVDLLERLPVPFGLVRYGVAPDHARLKTVTSVFAKIAQDARFRFFGNVELGRDVGIDQLRELYHGVVVATGVGADRKLGIEGEQLQGVHAASDFVGWYNGRPESARLEFDLSAEAAVVVGQGNVALDVCRILAKPVRELGRSDIAGHALRALARSQIRDIHLVGRRGPAQAKFTPKELRELATLPGWQIRIDTAALALGPACREELADPANAAAAKNVEFLTSCASAPLREDHRHIHLHFNVAPIALDGHAGLQSVVLEKQSLRGPARSQRASGTGELRRIDAGLLFRSVGYHGTALAGLPFDGHLGVIPNDRGRIFDEGAPLPGAYVTGWIKRGPVGIIGTNRVDSIETVSTLLTDLSAMPRVRPGRVALEAALSRRGRRVVAFDHWLEIEREELRRGRALEKAAEKLLTVEEMLAFARPSRAAAEPATST